MNTVAVPSFPFSQQRSALLLNNLFIDYVTFAPIISSSIPVIQNEDTEKLLDSCNQQICKVRNENWTLSAKVLGTKYPCATNSPLN